MAQGIDQWVEDNYEELVNAGRRTYADIEQLATEGNDKALAAWARRRNTETSGVTTSEEPDATDPVAPEEPAVEDPASKGKRTAVQPADAVPETTEA